MNRDGVYAIRVLPQDVARKIAAGEVIDRPAALVRELLDNAIDAGASAIEVAIEGGGIGRTEVIDDGRGMDREDLELCWLPHATSKIRTEEDLAVAETLGFRGEALAAVCAVAKLEILTSTDGREAWRLDVGPGTSGASAPRIEASRRSRGSSVRALGLYDAIPVRKKFLKREAAEAGMCRQALIDKALAFPELCFRLVQDGELILFLQAVKTLKERFVQALGYGKETNFIHELSASGPGFTATAVVGGPELHRRDRRQQLVFANGRRIQDFSLIQALEYGTQGWFPNGSHPVGALYVDIDPSLADFNIHPAKREVRFRDGPAIHHAVTTILRDFFHHRSVAALDSAPSVQEFAYPQENGTAYRALAGAPHVQWKQPGAGTWSGGAGYGRAGMNPHSASLAMEALMERPPDFVPLPFRSPPGEQGMTQDGEDIRYLGQAFGLFLLVQRGEAIYAVDQHAAHERILYDQFLSAPIPRQDLLIPYPFGTDSPEEDAFLETQREALASLGIIVSRDPPDRWLIEALPSAWKTGDEETAKAILQLRQAGSNMAESWAATLACRSAVMDGAVLDRDSALAIAEKAFRLPEPRCPHGRPIWLKLELRDLLKAVRRTE